MDTLLALFIGLVAGLLFYFFDFKRGLNAYRKWYDLTNKDELPDDVEMGFAYKQPFSGKLYTAIALSLFITLLVILAGSQNLFVELLYGVFILAGVMGAFYLAPLIFRHGGKHMNKLKKAVDKIDQFEADLKSKEKEKVKIEVKEEKEQKEEEPKEIKEEKKDDDWRKGVKKFLDD